MNESQFREQFHDLARAYFEKFSPPPIIPGETYIPVSGKVLDANDLIHLVDSSLDMWLTTGRFAHQFEKDFAKFMGARNCLLVNSGSSANLLAFSTLTSPALKDRAIQPGDEVITVAAGFPTTVNPILQNGCVPVFVDIQLPTYEIDVDQLEQAYSSKTKAVMVAHTLGNSFDLKSIVDFCKKHNLWLIEDACDAVGTTYKGRPVGSFGDLATVSFYPAHHITMGEGGAVLVNNPQLKKLALSFRDWGRDCWCDTGCDNTCKKRFGWNLGELPDGYDHKYIYTHVGYNLKLSDMQAAVGCSQLQKLPAFIEKRKENFKTLHGFLQDLQDVLILPEATPHADPSWFGFPITLQPGAKVSRNELVSFLEENKIGTRLLFAGNLTKQPLYRKDSYRVVGELRHTDTVMRSAFWVGVFPRLEPRHLQYMADKIREKVMG